MSNDLTNLKPLWNRPYSVAAATWNHYLWVDPSALFNCSNGIDVAKTFLKGNDMVMLFSNPNRHEDPEVYKPYMPSVIIKNMSDWWLKCQYESTEYCKRYNAWQKLYGKK